MTTPEGLVTFNLLCYDKATKDNVFGMLQELNKSYKYFIDGEEEVNRVIHLLKSEGPKEEDERQRQKEEADKSYQELVWKNEQMKKEKQK